MNPGCEIVSLELPAYARNGLDATAAAAVERHVRSCAGCERELHELRRLESILATAIGPIDPSPTFASAFANRLAAEIADGEEEAGRRRLFGGRFLPWLVPLAAAAVLALVVVNRTPVSPTPPPTVAKVEEPAVEVERDPAPKRVIARAPKRVADDSLLATPPRELLERPDLFVDYSVIEQLDFLEAPGRAG